MDDRGGWSLEDAAAVGAIGGHAGTHMSQGLASGDTIGGTTVLAHDPSLAEGPTASNASGPVEPSVATDQDATDSSSRYEEAAAS